MSTMKDAVTLLDYSPDALVAIDEFDAVRWAIAESDRAAAEHRSAPDLRRANCPRRSAAPCSPPKI